MNTSQISLKKEELGVYSVYLLDNNIGSIIDNLRYDLFFYLKIGSFLEIKLEDFTYILKCVNSGSAGSGGCYTKFKLLSDDKKEIAKIETTTNFFQSGTWNTFFTRTNKINYFQYKHYGNKSVWQDETKKDILIFKQNSVTFDENVLNDKQELYLLIFLTLCIEKFILKKNKIGLIKLTIFAIAVIPFIIFLSSIFLAK